MSSVVSNSLLEAFLRKVGTDIKVEEKYKIYVRMRMTKHDFRTGDRVTGKQNKKLWSTVQDNVSEKEYQVFLKTKGVITRVYGIAKASCPNAILEEYAWHVNKKLWHRI